MLRLRCANNGILKDFTGARNEQISGFTGIDAPYQPPLAPEVECGTDSETIKGSSVKVVSAILSFFASRSGRGSTRTMSIRETYGC